MICVFKIVVLDGDIDYWTTYDLKIGALQRLIWAQLAGSIEEYRRSLQQCCGAEKAQVRAAREQHKPIGFVIRAFLRLEMRRFNMGISWYETKLSIVREAVRSYLAAPTVTLLLTA